MDHWIAWVCHHTDRVGGVHTCGMWPRRCRPVSCYIPPHRLPTSLTSDLSNRNSRTGGFPPLRAPPMRAFYLLALSSLLAANVAMAVSRPSTDMSSSCFVPTSLPRAMSSLQRRRPYTPSPATSSRSSCCMRLNANQSPESPSLFERAFSATPYLLPVLDSINYSRFLAFYAPDLFNPIYAALDPLLAVYKASPFINLAIYLLIVWVGRQPALSRYVRFNFQQAIILDVALVIPSILTSILREQAAPVWVQEPVANTLFFILSASLAYVAVKLTLGQKPNEIPLISEAAEMTAGPF
ncbi:plant like protein [Nannochloropsis gaditana]|uniref:Plant like protein n=1 Tax=Nannochloropsis gaditana TaxID=72520 RepID=W7T2B9_9STRA|nr:plant like protein [Nannochloropsis gaditana]